MILTVLNSNSDGNCYLLTATNGDVLMIECGVFFSEVKKALNYNISSIIGCIVSHEHLDHCKGLKEVIKSGINVYSSAGSIGAFKYNNHRLKPVSAKEQFTIGDFKIIPFDVVHDAAEPYGYLINHKECGNVLFITDTSYINYKFPNLNNILIEANFSEKILEKYSSNTWLSQRIIKSHLSVETCEEILNNTDLKSVNNIVLLHLSDRNSDELLFKSKIEKATGKTVFVADAGLKINLDETPF